MTMLDDGPRQLSRADFMSFINSRMREAEMFKRYRSAEEEEVQEGLGMAEPHDHCMNPPTTSTPRRCSSPRAAG